MRRYVGANIAWLLLVFGISSLLCFTNHLYGLVLLYLGFFMRLIYNAEKYKFFKYVNLGLLKKMGVCSAQKNIQSLCLWGFYRAVIDTIAIVVLPFIIVPALNWPWYIDTLVAIVYLLSLKPIFSPIDEADIKLANEAIDKTTNYNSVNDD